MRKGWLENSSSCHLGVLTGLTGCLAVFLIAPVYGQVIADDTLGVERSRVRQETIRGLDSDRIEGGARRGGNLFHSFTQLDVEEGRGVYFANPEGVFNILSRVTGGDRSEIFGTLGVLGSANLFLINPNGILFGSNANLDVQGSFTASTASGVWLGDQGVFSATSPELSNLLEVNPGALLFNQAVARGGTITSTANLTAEQDLTLSGLNLDLQGQLWAGRNLTLYGADSVQIRDSSLNPFIAASGEQLLVQGDRTVDIFALNHPNSGLLSGGDMVLQSGSQVGGNAHYWSGGNFRVEQLDGVLGNLYSPYGMSIQSLEDVSFNVYQGGNLHIVTAESVNADTVIVDNFESKGAGFSSFSETITRPDGSTLLIDDNAQAIVDIRAGVRVAEIKPPDVANFLELPSQLSGVSEASNLTAGGDIFIGDIFVVPPSSIVYLTNQYSSSDFIEGGTIAITGSGLFEREGKQGNGIDARGFTGNGSQIIIDSRGDISVSNSSLDTSSTTSNGGNIRLFSERDIILSPIGEQRGSTIRASSQTGQGGDITLTASRNIQIEDSVVNADSRQGSNITLTASRNIQIEDSVVNADSEQGSNITINAQNLDISSSDITRTEISTDILVFGNGTGGNIRINALDHLTVNDSDIRARLGDEATGNASGIFINSNTVSVVNGGVLDVSTLGQGNAGIVFINARDSVLFDGVEYRFGSPSASYSNVRTGAVGNGGSINIQAGSLALKNGGLLQSLVESGVLLESGGEILPARGNAGDISIVVREQVNIDGRREINGTAQPSLSGANAGVIRGLRSSGINNFVDVGAAGDSGSIYIEAALLSIDNGAQINASNFGVGRSGDISLDISGELRLNGNSTFSRFEGDLDNRVRVTYLLNSAILNIIGQDAKGSGGDIHIQAGSLSMRDISEISSSTFGEGDAGNIVVNARNNIFMTDLSSLRNVVEPGGNGNSGNINIQTHDLSLLNGAQIAAGIFRSIGNLPGGQGLSGGEVSIDATGLVNLSGVSSINLPFPVNNPLYSPSSFQTEGLSSGILTLTESGATGRAGNINIRSNELRVLDGAVVTAQTQNSNNASNVTVIANSLEIVNGGQILTGTSGAGKAGDMDINVLNEAVFSGFDSSFALRLENFGRDVIANSSPFSGLFANTEPNSAGNGGNINLQVGSLHINDRAQVLASTLGTGSAGNINVGGSRMVTLNNGLISTEINSGAILDTSNTNQGNISLQTDRLFLTNNAAITASTSGQGNAGSIAIRNANTINLDRSTISSTVNPGAIGDGGSINLQTNSLNLDGSNITASTAGQGNAGSVAIRDANVVNLDRSTISSTVNPRAIGSGGSINLQTNSLNLDRSNITASTSGQGSAGNIRIRDAETVSLAGRSTISTAVAPIGIGRGGDITIQSESLHLGNRSNITASAGGQGRAGDIRVNGANAVTLANRSNISATTQGNGRRAGDITMNSDILNLTSGGRLRTNTNNDRRAGSIIITGAENLTVNGRNSGIFANTSPTSGGRGGRIAIATDDLTLERRGTIAAQSRGTGRAGRVRIDAEDVTLNQAQISARSSQNQPAGDIRLNAANTFSAIDSRILTSARQSSGGSITLNAGQVNLNRSGISTSVATGGGNGGNIDINAENSVVLDNDSDIKTEVTSGRGDGGNIRVGADAILAFADSDILTTADAGRGGDIILGSSAFFGDNYQPDAPQSGDRVDVDASGEVDDGTITTPDTNFIQNSLADIPEAPLDTDRLLANSCLNRTQQPGRFTITGTDGLPQRPGNANQSAYPTGTIQSIPQPESSAHRPWRMGDAIVEPQGVARLPDGRLAMERECNAPQ
jgi:filamentous hemagglutinin family protein